MRSAAWCGYADCRQSWQCSSIHPPIGRHVRPYPQEAAFNTGAVQPAKASVARDLGQLVDRLEAAVGLDDRHEHLVEAFVLLRAERHRQAADVELAGLLDGLEQRLARHV